MANGEGVLFLRSHLFIVENVTPTFAANCSWVSPTWRATPWSSLPRPSYSCHSSRSHPDLALLLTRLGKQYST